MQSIVQLFQNVSAGEMHSQIYLLNPARACWCPFCVRFVIYASCTRSDCSVHVHLLSVTHSETFGLVELKPCFTYLLPIRFNRSMSHACTSVVSVFSTGLTFLPPDNKNSYPFHVLRFNPVKCDRGLNFSNLQRIFCLKYEAKGIFFLS